MRTEDEDEEQRIAGDLEERFSRIVVHESLPTSHARCTPTVTQKSEGRLVFPEGLTFAAPALCGGDRTASAPRPPHARANKKVATTFSSFWAS